MAKYKSWNYIANSFIAADKIRNLITHPVSENRGSSIIESNYSTIIEILRIISIYSPETTRKNLLNSALEKSDLYNNTYRSLKNHINSNASRGMDFENITEALSIIRPTLSNNHRSTVEKILKIYEILKSI